MSTSDDSQHTGTPADDAAPAVQPAPTTVEAAPTDALVDAWFNQFINDSVVSRNTEIFNYMREAVGHLKQQLAG